MTTISDAYRMLDLIVKIPPEQLKNLRLGHIIVNACLGDPYYMSNDQFLSALDSFVTECCGDRETVAPAADRDEWKRLWQERDVEAASLAARLAEAERWAKRAGAACNGVVNLTELQAALSELRRVLRATDSADGGRNAD